MGASAVRWPDFRRSQVGNAVPGVPFIRAGSGRNAEDSVPCAGGSMAPAQKMKGPLQNASFAAVPYYALKHANNREDVENGPHFPGIWYSKASPDTSTSAEC